MSSNYVIQLKQDKDSHYASVNSVGSQLLTSDDDLVVSNCQYAPTDVPDTNAMSEGISRIASASGRILGDLGENVYDSVSYIVDDITGQQVVVPSVGETSGSGSGNRLFYIIVGLIVLYLIIMLLRRL